MKAEEIGKKWVWIFVVIGMFIVYVVVLFTGNHGPKRIEAPSAKAPVVSKTQEAVAAETSEGSEVMGFITMQHGLYLHYVLSVRGEDSTGDRDSRMKAFGRLEKEAQRLEKEGWQLVPNSLNIALTSIGSGAYNGNFLTRSWIVAVFQKTN